MKFTRQLYQTSHSKAFRDFACRQIDTVFFLCVHVTLNAKTTVVQSIESVQLMCSFLLSLGLKVYIALLLLS